MKILLVIASFFFLLSCSSSETKEQTSETVKKNLLTDSFSIKCLGPEGMGLAEKIDTLILNNNILTCKLGACASCGTNKLDTFFVENDTLNLYLGGDHLTCDCYLKIFARLNYAGKIPKSIKVNGLQMGQGPCMVIKDDYAEEDEPIVIDPADAKLFWTSVVTPMVTGDSQTVLKNMSFPISGDWTFMMDLKKDPSRATRHDFAKIYNAFFDANLLGPLLHQTYKNVSISKIQDTMWYAISVNRSNKDGSEAGIILYYFKQGKHYKLKKVNGVGADFYYREGL